MKSATSARIATTNRSWPSAYKMFLLSRRESLLLKLAPIAILVGSPEIVASNIVPVIGEIADVSGLMLATVVAVRTYSAVKRYR